MIAHDLWHVLVLGSTLFALAGAAVLVLGSLLFDEPSPGLRRARPFVVLLVVVAGALIALEWLGVH